MLRKTFLCKLSIKHSNCNTVKKLFFFIKKISVLKNDISFYKNKCFFTLKNAMYLKAVKKSCCFIALLQNIKITQSFKYGILRNF